MSTKLKANVDGITGELFINATKVAKYTASSFDLIDSGGASKFALNLSTGAAVVRGSVLRLDGCNDTREAERAVASRAKPRPLSSGFFIVHRRSQSDQSENLGSRGGIYGIAETE